MPDAALIAGRTGLVADPQLPRIGNRAISRRTDGSSWKILSTSADSCPHGSTATEMESLCTSNPRWIGPEYVTLLMAAGSFRLWLRPLESG